jgi:hypothetical protein
MTAEERTAHRDKLLSAKKYDECETMQQDQHKAMIERVKERGKALPTRRQTGYDRMQMRSFSKWTQALRHGIPSFPTVQ